MAATAAASSELPPQYRSILANMLPEGLLLLLVNYGVERFAEVFVGTYDNPEVIWSLEMRQHLVEMIQQHLGDFPLRLKQHNTAQYEHCAMPKISYPLLQGELFCHNYYLRNLCNEKRFPQWPISEPLQVFRSSLQLWKEQMSRHVKEETNAQEEAKQILGLNNNNNRNKNNKNNNK